MLNLQGRLEWATREERKIFVRMMIEEVGVDFATKQVVWVKARPDYEPLSSILDRMRQDADRRFWIERSGVSEDNCGIEEDTGHVSTGVEILLPMSDKTLSCNTLTSAEEYIE